MNRLFLAIDPVYHVICQDHWAELSDNMTGVQTIITVPSYLTQQTCEVIEILEGELASEPALYAAVKADCNRFVFDFERGVLRRPALVIKPVGDWPVNSVGITMLPLGQDIPMQVVYEDPDGVGFAGQFDEVKLKDRADFATVSTDRLTLDPATGTAQFTVRSDFPGIAKLRAKDNKYLCYFKAVHFRFKQGIA